MVVHIVSEEYRVWIVCNPYSNTSCIEEIAKKHRSSLMIPLSIGGYKILFKREDNAREFISKVKGLEFVTEVNLFRERQTNEELKI